MEVIADKDNNLLADTGLERRCKRYGVHYVAVEVPPDNFCNGCAGDASQVLCNCLPRCRATNYKTGEVSTIIWK